MTAGGRSTPLTIGRQLQGGQAARLAPAGELDIATVPQLEQELASLLSEGMREVAIDLGGISFMDSSALRMFILLSGRAAREDWRLRIVNPSEQARSVFEITGADQHLPLELGDGGKEHA